MFSAFHWFHWGCLGPCPLPAKSDVVSTVGQVFPCGLVNSVAPFYDLPACLGYKLSFCHFLPFSSEDKSCECKDRPDAEESDGAEDDASYVQQEPLAADPAASGRVRQQSWRCGGTTSNTGQHQATAATDNDTSSPVEI